MTIFKLDMPVSMTEGEALGAAEVYTNGLRELFDGLNKELEGTQRVPLTAEVDFKMLWGSFCLVEALQKHLEERMLAEAAPVVIAPRG